MEEETKVQEEAKPEAETGDASRRKMEEIGKPLEKMTAIELREVAVLIKGVTGVSAMKKEDLLPIIKEAWGIAADETPVRKKEIRPGVTVKDLKAKAARFRQEKASAQEANERRTVKTLRRRINRLKKKTRKAARA